MTLKLHLQIKCNSLVYETNKYSKFNCRTWVFVKILLVCLFLAQQPPVGHGLLIHEVSRSHTTTVGRTPLDEWSARRRDLYLTTDNTHNNQTSIPPVGFEPTISAGERRQTYDLVRAATGTGKDNVTSPKINKILLTSAVFPRHLMTLHEWLQLFFLIIKQSYCWSADKDNVTSPKINKILLTSAVFPRHLMKLHEWLQLFFES